MLVVKASYPYKPGDYYSTSGTGAFVRFESFSFFITLLKCTFSRDSTRPPHARCRPLYGGVHWGSVQTHTLDPKNP